RAPRPTLFPYTTLFRSWAVAAEQKLNLVGIAISRAVKTPALGEVRLLIALQIGEHPTGFGRIQSDRILRVCRRLALLGSSRVATDRKSTRLNSSHVSIS